MQVPCGQFEACVWLCMVVYDCVWRRVRACAWRRVRCVVARAARWCGACLLRWHRGQAVALPTPVLLERVQPRRHDVARRGAADAACHAEGGEDAVVRRRAAREVGQWLCGPWLTRRQELGVGVRGDECVQRVHGRLLLLARRRCVDCHLGLGLAPLALGRVAAAVAAAVPVRQHVLELRRHLVAGLGAAHDNATRQKLRVGVRRQERSHALAVALSLTPLRHGCSLTRLRATRRTKDALDAENLDLCWRRATLGLQHANLTEDLDLCRRRWLCDNQLLGDDPRATARPDDLLSIGGRRRRDVRLQRRAAELAKGAAYWHFRQPRGRPKLRRFRRLKTKLSRERSSGHRPIEGHTEITRGHVQRVLLRKSGLKSEDRRI